MSHPSLKLENQFCFLIHRLNRAITARYKPLLDDFGLTYPQYLAMLALWEGKALSIGELCELLHLDTGTVSPLIKRLEQQGLVSRTRNPQDERSVVVGLTDAGRDMEGRIRMVPLEMAGCLGRGLKDTAMTQETWEDLWGKLSGLVQYLEADGCEDGIEQK